MGPAIVSSVTRTGDTLPARLDAICRARADAVALIDGVQRLTFAEARGLIERVAGHLGSLGVGPGSVVSWQLPNWWEAAVLHHAVLRAGGIPNPLNPAFRAHELRHIVAEARPHILAVPETWRGFDHIGMAKELRQTWGMRYLVVRGRSCTTMRFEDLIEQPAPAEPPPAPPDPGAHALLLYTSGTTSRPKGVQHTHRGLLAEIDTFPEIHGVTPEDRYLGAPPVAHIAGLVYGFLVPFALGTSTALLDRWDPAAALALIARERVTFMTGPPTFLQTLADHPDAGTVDVSSFRLFSTGGASIPTDVIRRAAATLGCVVKRAYGSTEMPTLTATMLEDDERARLETDGRAIGDAEIRIVRTDGAPVAPGEEGEIWARGPELFTGYRDAGLDAEAFTADGWYRTGDLGTLDLEGLLRVTGRIADIIIRGGENIAAKEIEDLLLEHPAVSEAAVFGLPDERLGERVCAIVSVRDGAAFDETVMLEHLRAAGIATHKLPERLEARDEPLPKTESGKIRKAELRAALIDAPS